jgi:sugar (pentulose or hexulose) kinase
MGAIAPGDAGASAGWSAPVQMVTAAPVFDADRRTWASVHVAPGRWILESNAGETGRAWEWTCAMLGCSAAEADALAASAAAGSGDVMAVLGARVMNSAAMNAGVGAITMPLPFVMSAPDRGQVLRSVLESIAYAVRANLEQLESIGGARIERLRVGGGMSRSRLFTQIVADVIDRPVEVAASPEATAIGAAALAFVATRRCESIEDAVAAMCGNRRVVAPDVRASAAYEDHYARWCALADEMERLGSL